MIDATNVDAEYLLRLQGKKLEPWEGGFLEAFSECGGILVQILVPSSTKLCVKRITIGDSFAYEAPAGSSVILSELRLHAPVRPYEHIEIYVVNEGSDAVPAPCAMAILRTHGSISKVPEKTPPEEGRFTRKLLANALYGKFGDTIQISQHHDILGREHQARLDAEKAKTEVEAENSRLRREIERLKRATAKR